MHSLRKILNAQNTAIEECLRLTRIENDRLIENSHLLQEHIHQLLITEDLISARANSGQNLAPEALCSMISIEDELNMVVEHLHRTQEKLDDSVHALTNTTNEAEKLKQRIKRLLAKAPETWEAESFSVTQSKEAKDTLLWKITELFLEELYIDQLEFTTQLIDNNIKLVILSGTKDSNPIIIEPVAGTAVWEANAMVTNLSSFDWFLANKLCQKLDEYTLAKPKNTPKLLTTHRFSKGLNNLISSIKSWPAVLRYDNYKAVELPVRAHYSGLLLAFENLSLQNKIWSQCEIILSTVDFDEKAFGDNPRFEFPEVGSSHVLKSWYAEKDDQFGKRFELRFASPDIMDIAVWKSLIGEDQLLVAALTICLPSILKREGTHLASERKTKEQWVHLAELIKLNFSRNLANDPLSVN